MVASCAFIFLLPPPLLVTLSSIPTVVVLLGYVVRHFGELQLIYIVLTITKKKVTFNQGFKRIIIQFTKKYLWLNHENTSLIKYNS